MEIEWKFLQRPSYFGKRKAEILKGYDDRYGKDNWRMVWEWGKLRLEWLMAVQLYEDAYYHFLNCNPKLLNDIIAIGEVYDNNPSNIASGLNYTKQETPATHLQDIAVRRCLVRFGVYFQGKDIIQIRHNSASPIGQQLSPGYVPFHLPTMIKQPQLTGWWNPNTVEAFYQSNKLIEVKQ